jgi:hypothetical protein
MDDTTGEPAMSGVRGPETPTAQSQVSGRPRRKRPMPVTILAGFELLSAIVYGAFILLLVQGDAVSLSSVMQFDMDGERVAKIPLLLFAALVVFFMAALASAVLLLRVRRLGWTITMLLAGTSLSAQIYLWWSGQSVPPVWLLVNVLTVFYLNQRQVREAFGIGLAPGAGDQEAVRP